jgi:hypothetical protein
MFSLPQLHEIRMPGSNRAEITCQSGRAALLTMVIWLAWHQEESSRWRTGCCLIELSVERFDG